MTDYKTISAYDSQVDNYVDIINQQPVDNILLGYQVICFIAQYFSANRVCYLQAFQPCTMCIISIDI